MSKGDDQLIVADVSSRYHCLHLQDTGDGIFWFSIVYTRTDGETCSHVKVDEEGAASILRWLTARAAARGGQHGS
jgi:hypothetical protein